MYIRTRIIEPVIPPGRELQGMNQEVQDAKF
jgi:hypothetical protein